VFLGIITFITTAEWFFWDEFGARFNFIAVDYLVWTQEVWGNISQSYPLVPIFLGIGILAALVILGLIRIKVFKWMTSGETGTLDRILWPISSLLATAIVAFTVYQSAIPAFKNSYHIEIAKNGYWSFLTAFHEMELDYAKWYAVTPQEQALSDAKKLLTTANEASSPTPDDMRRTIQGRGEEHRWNVILVCMESMSGEYMSYVGKNSALTPNLNRLAEQSIFFENLYATGTRTVRGMEAITLNLPPTPGQAIIYRPEGTDLVTTFTPFLNRGYDCAFFYGGDGRFDYMNRYFSTS
jgi:phosphoglycerol transferase MdoB-like AlkP superfamily enzyme